jgi:hypothetical protein
MMWLRISKIEERQAQWIKWGKMQIGYNINKEHSIELENIPGNTWIDTEIAKTKEV